LRNNGNEDQAFKLAFKTLLYVVGFQQAIVRVGVKVDGDVFLECRFKFGPQCFNKLRNPLISLIVFVTIGDEDIVFVPGDYGWHMPGLRGWGVAREPQVKYSQICRGLKFLVKGTESANKLR
jgi:hypothetical protein